jgi:hypothetical protein
VTTPLEQYSQKAAPNAGILTVDEKQGIVECFVAAIGNKDSVGDIIIPGAFNKSLQKRKPRVVWGHDWNQPIGKVLDIYEVGPRDPRLPAKMRAAGVGGLYAKVQFNLHSERGREAFSFILFYGDEQEWCVDEETEILTSRGWLRYDEVTDEDMAYVLDPELGCGRFEEIQAVNIWDSKTRGLRLIETGGFSSLTTASHRWPTASNNDGGKVEWRTTETLRPQDRIVRTAPRADAPVLQKYTDSFVELVGWFWTEGWVPPADHTDAGLYIAQSTAKNPQHVGSIRAALEAEFPGQWSERHSTDEMARFRLKREAAESILSVTGEGKAPTPEFLLALTRSQLDSLISVCLQGDGHVSKSGQATWYQVSENGVRTFEMLCALAGRATNTTQQKNYGNRFGTPPQRVSLLRTGVAKPLDAVRVKSDSQREPRTPSIDSIVLHEGIVWCPTTPSGTWLARRKGSIYFTGNSIGYKTIDSEFNPSKQANILKELELFEVSPVLHGANQLTATVSIKSANPTSARKMSDSPWGVFDPSFVIALRKDHPDLWSLVEDPQGDEINMLLTLPALDPDTPLSIKELTALTVRDEWAEDHAQGSTLTDVISLAKRFVVGTMGEQSMKELIAEAVKAPIPPDAIPQERITGDVMRGYGPRRGNLERLLRYWRPIMRQPGGFRRCLVILADHPELYPLANICAWLHHETTGLWPNEGCHHPGMKNCRKKLRGWTDAQFADRLPGGKGFPMDDEGAEVVTDDDVEYANRVLKGFCDEEKEFIGFLGDEENWEHIGDTDDDDEVPHMMAGEKRPCGCGGGCGKSESSEEILEKAGRVLSSANLGKIQQAVTLLNQVVQSTGIESTEVKSVLIEADVSDLFDVKSYIDPVLEFYGLDAEVTEQGIKIKSPMSNDAFDAIETAVAGFVELKEGNGK